jgi:hypothetical protein
MRYQVLKGVSTQSTYKRLVPNSAEQAAQGIPGWKLLISPDASFLNTANGRIQDRVSGKWLTPKLQTYLPTIGGMPATIRPSFSFPQSGPVQIYPSVATVNPTAWTAFFVCYFSPGVAPDEIFGPTGNVNDPDYALRFGFNGSGILRVWQGSSTIRLFDDGNNYYDEVVYCMATFSTTDGLRMFRNGVEVEKNENDLNALTFTELQLFGSGNAGDENGFSGHIGHLGLLDICLAETRYSAEKATLDNWMTNFYGL